MGHGLPNVWLKFPVGKFEPEIFPSLIKVPVL